MAIVCPECGSVNKKGNKFCFECGMRLPAETDRPSPEQGNGQPATRSSTEAKRIHLRKRWLNGEISAEEYRGHLLRLRLKERFGSHYADDLDEKNGEKKDKK